MSTNRDDPSSTDARDNRRWFIGIGISVVFGLFGMIMTLLSYAARTKPAAAPAPRATAPRGAPEPARRGKERGERNR
jgi:hypothetical protein